MEKHIENLKRFGIGVIVALNRFHTDSDAELALVEDCCRKNGVAFSLSDVFTCGGEGGVDLARQLVAMLEQPSAFRPLYDASLSLKEKIETIVKEIYGGSAVSYSAEAEKELARLEQAGYGGLPVCMAKTQYSLSDTASLLGRPEGFTFTVREVRLFAGAGFVTVYCGNIMTMPGLPAQPAAMNITVTDDGKIQGLF